MKNILIVSPIYPPAVGGASIYYHALSELLASHKNINSIVILTEKFGNEKNVELIGKILIVRIFPQRGGMKRERFKQYIKYAVQNLQYFYIPFLIKKYSINIVLIHSSFHININLMHWVMKITKRKNNVKLIADVRDLQLSINKLRQLDTYDTIISCSLTVEKHLKKRVELMRKVTVIPILQNPITCDIKEYNSTLKRFNLNEVKYIFYAGLLKKEKGLNLLLELFNKYSIINKNIKLVLSGTLKETGKLAKEININPHIFYLGPLNHEDIIPLIKAAEITVNLSPSEGLSRFSLESIALKAKTILPRNVEEFQYCCPQSVAKKNINELIRQLDITINKSIDYSYDIERHYPKNVLRLYLDII